MKIRIMKTRPTPDALETPERTLSEVNEDLHSWLVRLRPERSSCSSISREGFAAIISQLRRAAACLRGQRTNPAGPEFEQEARDYRANLERLLQFLPSLQVRLLAEKARLETARTHVASASAWAAGASQHTR
jgi:hypothetical protein